MRDQIRHEIATIVPHDELERQHQTQALAWVDSGAELCRLVKPVTPAMHLVAYFGVIDEGQLLLVDHRNAQLWLPPGGHVEPDEHPRTTVLRELREELGFAPAHEIAAPLMITCTETVGATAGHTDVSLWYVVHTRREQAITFDPAEFKAVRWFAFADAPLAQADPHLGRFLAKVREAR